MPNVETDFLAGIRTMTTAGDVYTQVGMAAHVYVANTSMVDDHFFNADGEMLIVPQEGGIRVLTEMGVMDVTQGEICILPRGMVFKVELIDGPVRGYICENYGAKFTMPDRGPIGANCLANPRDFKTPVAWFEEKETPCRLIVKWCGQFHVTEIGHSPLDVVAWHGNYAPYKYDLATFSPVGAILFDHPDPSIFTVLTAPSGEEGTANVDFVIFPPRWLVAEHTFRPPWYHRNVMSEFMGLIHGKYDAKEEGFVPGGISLHNMMLAHGPDADGYHKATQRRPEAGEARQYDGVHVRDALSADADALCRRTGDPPGQLHRVLVRARRSTLTAPKRATGLERAACNEPRTADLTGENFSEAWRPHETRDTQGRNSRRQARRRLARPDAVHRRRIPRADAAGGARQLAAHCAAPRRPVANRSSMARCRRRGFMSMTRIRRCRAPTSGRTAPPM